MTDSKTLAAKREIIQHFSAAISEKKQSLDVPKNDVIDFRNEKETSLAREIWLVPIDLLHFRPDNNRINAKMKTYMKYNPDFDDVSGHTKPEFQKIIADKLKEQDKTKFKELKSLIKAKGQDKYAIATCDGFLIDGNRRKAVMEELFKEDGGKQFSMMKVILLPDGKKEGDGGAPTNQEIRTLERILQISKDGRSEYTKLNKALSMKEEIMLLEGDKEAYLKADPGNRNIIGDKRKFNKALKEIQNDYLGPLEMIDQYLIEINKEDEYTIIEEKGNWNAFRDFYLKIIGKVSSDNGYTPEDASGLTDIGFKMLSTGNFDREIMHEIRDLKKYWDDNEQRKKISFIKKLDNPELISDHNEANKVRENIRDIVKKTREIKSYTDAKDKPLKLIKDALAKIDKIDIEDVNSEYDEILTKLRDLKHSSDSLESKVFTKNKNLGKDLKELKKKLETK